MPNVAAWTIDVHALFDGMPMKNVESWSAIISTYIMEERLEEALVGLFRKFPIVGFAA